MINVPEILVASVSAITLIVAILFFSSQNNRSKHTDEKIFQIMLVVTMIAVMFEAISFILDGKYFFGDYYILYFLNTFWFILTDLVALLWCLFVDYKLYCNVQRIKKKIIFLGIPYVLLIIFLIINLFAKGFIFDIVDNKFVEGRFDFCISMLLILYYLDSLITYYNAKRRGVIVKFFPLFLFIIPAMFGAIIQEIFYGITTGWLSVAIAYVFIYLQLQNFNVYVDEISGLFNHKYLNFYFNKNIKNTNKEFYGIMLDANDFKKINDIYGHSIGDHAIYDIGTILSSSILDNSIAIRYAGDEFVILIKGSIDQANMIVDNIKNNINIFNKTNSEPFKLSLSIGLAKYEGETIEEFISKIDKKMYEDKDDYYKNNKKSR